jgi:hypothetical protein
MTTPIPADARSILPTLTLTQAGRHYGVSRPVVKRWARQLRVTLRAVSREEWGEFARLAKRHCLTGELPAEKQCTACGETKPAGAYRRNVTARGAPYLYSRCKACMTAGIGAKVPRRRPEPLPSHDPWERELYVQALRAFGVARG